MFGDATALYERARNWAIGSDPGLLRLRMATRTTGALATALLVLFLLTKATGQPLTVALLGVLITMVVGAVGERARSASTRITMALLPLPTALAITAAALVSPHPVVGDVVFVVVVFIAVYVRRFGPRGTALGMVTFMSYFFTLYLRAKFSELPWLIGADVVGTLCSFVWSAFILPDRPESVLRRTIRSLRARMAIVVDTTADTLRPASSTSGGGAGCGSGSRRLNETALMVQAQIEDRVNPGALWPGVSGEDLALWLFDAELTVERVATAGARAAASADIPAATRAELADTVAHADHGPSGYHTPMSSPARPAQRCSAAARAPAHPGDVPVRRLALAIVDMAKATAEVRDVDRARRDRQRRAQAPPALSERRIRRAGMSAPTTRQAIQVAVAAALAIVVGESVSPSHWYWAAIAAFVIFAGTNSWAETLYQGLAAAAGYRARCAQWRADRHARVRQHARLARDDLRMSVLRFLFHEGHLQPDDLLDHHDARVAVRSARRIHLRPAAVADRGDRHRRSHRYRRRDPGVADQHPSDHPQRCPHVLPAPCRNWSRRRWRACSAAMQPPARPRRHVNSAATCSSSGSPPSR